MKTPKQLKNPALRVKFKVGDRVLIPRDIAWRFVRMMFIPGGHYKFYSTVAAAGDRQIGKHYRFAVDVEFECEQAIHPAVEIWEERMLEKIEVGSNPVLAGRQANALTSELEAVRQLRDTGRPLSAKAKLILEEENQ